MRRRPIVPLEYSTVRMPAARIISRLVLATFLACLALPLAAWGMLRALPHDQVCPSCGGWGAAGLIAATVGLAVGSIATQVLSIRRGAGWLTLILSTLTSLIALAYVAVAVGFYQAIQS